MTYAILFVLILILVLFFLSKSYDKEFIDGLDSKEHPLKRLYSFVGFCWFQIIHRPQKSNRKETASLYQKGALMTFVFLLFLIILLINEQKAPKEILQDGYKIERPEVGEGSKTYHLGYQLGAEEEDLTFEITEKQVKKEDRKKMFQAAEAALYKIILNKNIDFNQVTSDLKFPKQFGSPALSVSYKTGQSDYLWEDGSIRGEGAPKEGIPTSINVTLRYFEDTYEFQINITILPPIEPELSIKEIMELEVKRREEENREEEMVTLPSVVLGDQVLWKPIKNNSSIPLLLIGILVMVCIPFFIEQKKREREQQKQEQLLLDYPEIMMKYTLLLSAGMTTYGAWERIVKDYNTRRERELGGTRRNKKKLSKSKSMKSMRYAYEEMIITKNEIDLGVSESVAYERFGRRCKLLSYLRFSTIIVQNMKKGNKGMIPMLEAESVQALLDRKEQAKRLGERASTKMLMPMMGMLCIVIAILMVPAMMSMGM
ncbi:hypothetical protein [Lachnoclostridium phytofermentans]|uniref:Type II secretion system protein GspF domain-containing protein n=1 Tax=Lachnoclostridium phytofermentans (strain ATCC 700394 / DSM 18823 / ISDg) TaxID=357809 RepID=A9KQB5_LACP7|nr:hypothetical protein [Lachnoclostridium phytofermentans]ABX40424.1 hypothetical protein Cphy_0034 [Lachnoclostridium phytofermentans ISDg]